MGSGKYVQDMRLEDSKISDQDHGFSGGHVNVVGDLCSAEDPMLCDSSTATHDGVYNNYSLNNIPDNGDKESNDDVFYGWGDMENFEDVDNMLRSCDSTFGLDSLNNEDDGLGWFSSAQQNEDTEAAMRDDIKPDTMLGNQRALMLQVEDFLNDSECNHDVEDFLKSSECCNHALGNSSENVYDTSLQKKYMLMLVDEANLETQQTDHLHHLDGKSDGFSENSFTLQHSGISSESNSGIKSEIKPNSSTVSNESYTSNQAQSVERLQGPNVGDRCRKGLGKRVNLPTAASARKSSKMVFPDGAPIPKMGLEDDHTKAAANLETSNRQESSCVSSVVDDVSLEATSFRQLQQVTEQLDVRTKLCIRDSLYRLAKSAEQRHVCINPYGGNREVKGAGEPDKYVGFMDIEADTNPIDRSIAHLLFHRPSDPSLSSDHDVLSYKSHPMIPQPNSSPSLRIEKQEEARELRTEAEVVASSK